MNKAIQLLDNYRLQEISKHLNLGSYETREELITRILEKSEESDIFCSLVATEIMSFFEKKYEILIYDEKYAFKQGELNVQARLEIAKRGDTASTVRIAQSLTRDGSIKREVWCSPLFSPEESALFKWVLNEWASVLFFKPISTQEEVPLFFAFLNDYYEKKNRRYVYKEFEKMFGSLYLVKFHLKGWEEFQFSATVDGKTHTVKRVCLETDGGIEVRTLLDEDELAYFLTEKSPLRMELLFQ